MSRLVFLLALLAFGVSVSTFATRVTDLSALRMLDGDVPYRDFWTMYAPGSFTVLALAFKVFGRQLIVSNVLGIITSAAAVACYYQLSARVTRPVVAVALTVLVAVAFLGTGYYDGFTSYPPTFLLILLAVQIAARKSVDPGWLWAGGVGLLLGAAALFKHDVAGYALVALTVSLLIVRLETRSRPHWIPAIVMGAIVLTVMGLATLVLLLLGAGPDLWRDLIRFPLVDFPHVRGEYFPLFPRLRDTWMDTARDFVTWNICNLPLIAYASGLPGIWRGWRTFDSTTRLVVLFAMTVFWLHWAGAHVQINTHAISLAAWGALVGAIGLRERRPSRGLVRLVPVALVVLWCGALVAERAAVTVTQSAGPSEWVGVPHLRGIRAPRAQAANLRQLAKAISDAADPSARLLFVSRRNDIDVFAESVPYWVSERRPASRYHELHPGIFDTEVVQREVLSIVSTGIPPVVVREHRFPDAVLDAVKAGMVQHVPVGSLLLDQWIAAHYEPGQLFGHYEVMARKAPSAHTAQ